MPVNWNEATALAQQLGKSVNQLTADDAYNAGWSLSNAISLGSYNKSIGYTPASVLIPSLQPPKVQQPAQNTPTYVPQVAAVAAAAPLVPILGAPVAAAIGSAVATAVKAATSSSSSTRSSSSTTPTVMATATNNQTQAPAAAPSNLIPAGATAPPVINVQMPATAPTGSIDSGLLVTGGLIIGGLVLLSSLFRR